MPPKKRFQSRLLSIALMLFLSGNCHAGNTPSASVYQHAQFKFTSSCTITFNEYIVITNETNHRVVVSIFDDAITIINPNRTKELSSTNETPSSISIHVQDSPSQRFQWHIERHEPNSTIYVKIQSIPYDDIEIV